MKRARNALLIILSGLLAFPFPPVTMVHAAQDPYFLDLWGLHTIDAPKAWAFHTGSLRTVVAVIDTGVDYTHPDLYLNIWINQREIPTAIFNRLVDVDGDGLITFWDLNDSRNQGPDTITDNNGNGYIDGGDLLYPVCTAPPRPGHKDLNGDGIPDDEEDGAINQAPPTCSSKGWADGQDDDGNGYLDDLIGWDFDDNDNDPMDKTFHGTHIAGTIGAVHNYDGVVGVNWQVRIMSLRIIPPGNRVPKPSEWKSRKDVDDLFHFLGRAADALRYAVDNGASISNHSYGTALPELDIPDWVDFLLALGIPMSYALEYAYQLAGLRCLAPLRDAIAYAQGKGHIVVAAAGNGEAVQGQPWKDDDVVGDNNDELPHYPASFRFDNVIAVAATDYYDRLTPFSNYGPGSVDLGAPSGVAFPGRSILSTTPTYVTEYMQAENIDLNYGMSHGTSMATPHVAGVAALVWDMNPTWSYQQVIQQVLGNVDPLSDLQDRTVTGGRVNAFRAVVPGPWITDTAIVTSDGATHPTQFSWNGCMSSFPRAIRLTFNESIDPATFTWNDDIGSQVQGTMVPFPSLYGIVPVSGSQNRQFDILFGPISSTSFGSISVALTIGPDIADLDGHRLDLDRDGVDGGPNDFHSFGFWVSMSPAPPTGCINVHDRITDTINLRELRELGSALHPPVLVPNPDFRSTAPTNLPSPPVRVPELDFRSTVPTNVPSPVPVTPNVGSQLRGLSGNLLRR